MFRPSTASVCFRISVTAVSILLSLACENAAAPRVTQTSDSSISVSVDPSTRESLRVELTDAKESTPSRVSTDAKSAAFLGGTKGATAPRGAWVGTFVSDDTNPYLTAMAANVPAASYDASLFEGYEDAWPYLFRSDDPTAPFLEDALSIAFHEPTHPGTRGSGVASVRGRESARNAPWGNARGQWI